MFVKKSLIFFVFLVHIMLFQSVLADPSGDPVQKYMKIVQERIYSNWKPNKLTESYKITANFKIDKLGTVRDLKLIKEHENSEANEAALAAIKKSEPFSSPIYLKLPDLESRGNIEIEFDFDYKVHRNPIKREIDLIADTPLMRDFMGHGYSKTVKYTVFALLVLLVAYFKIMNALDNVNGADKKKTTATAPEANRYDPTNVSNRD